MTTAQVKDWHDPRNEACPHNVDIFDACTCKRKRQRKPFRVVRVNDREQHDIVVTVFPDGLMHFRKKGRRRVYATTAGKVWSGLMWSAAMQAAKLAKAERKGRRKKRC